jgi:hypothetical protein
MLVEARRAGRHRRPWRLRRPAALVALGAVAGALALIPGTSSAATPGTLLLSGMTTPAGGVWLPGPGTSAGHYWTPDSLLGFCRVDP